MLMRIYVHTVSFQNAASRRRKRVIIYDLVLNIKWCEWKFEDALCVKVLGLKGSYWESVGDGWFL